jgi:hypothetical protein
MKLSSWGELADNPTIATAAHANDTTTPRVFTPVPF